MPEHSFDRRTLVVGAAGTLLAAAFGEPMHAAGRATASLRRARFDPRLARQLQQALDEAVAGPEPHAPGAILHVESPAGGAWTGAAGIGRRAPEVPMRVGDRFRAGSVAKPFVAVVVLQLVEERRLSLDARLPDVLPRSVVRRFPHAADISVRMLLSHRSGIPEWSTPAADKIVAQHPAKVWTVSEMLDRAAAQRPLFAPGTKFSYSNTNYNLLGLVIEHASGRSWRHEVTHRVLNPLGLRQTALPAPGNLSLMGPHAHGYLQVDGKTIDLTAVDPSMAGAAGGSALVTTVHDLSRFLVGLLANRLFRHRETLHQMLDFSPAPGEGGRVGYGLGIERRLVPGGVELIDHLGETAGYTAYVGRLRHTDFTLSAALNWGPGKDPSPLLLPAIHAIAAAHR
jgi:D-alanyl-D-alanine carboxypeptidase